MKLSIRSRDINITVHVLIWAVLLLLPFLLSTAANGYKIGLMPGPFFTATVFIHMAIFYGNAYFLYPKLLTRAYWWLYVIASTLLILASSQLKIRILAAWFPGVLESSAAYRVIIVPSVAVFVISSIYREIVDRRHFEKKQKEIEAVRLSTELKFLRSQISPHFLFNVLTNLVSLARKKSDQLETSLIMLSDLMRYMLYDAQGKKVELYKEIEYLNSYVKLQKLRFGNEVQIDSCIETDDEDGHYPIEPMLLIPFVENAFKHGVGYSGGPRIEISLSVKEGWMSFEVRNKFDDGVGADDRSGEGDRARSGGRVGADRGSGTDGRSGAGKDESSGIGLGNVRARLDLLYRNNYTLTTDDRNHLFQIALTLKLI